jgi:hypothetical protein
VESHLQEKQDQDNKRDVNFENKKQGCRLSREIRKRSKRRNSNRSDPIYIDDQDVPSSPTKYSSDKPGTRDQVSYDFVDNLPLFLIGLNDFPGIGFTLRGNFPKGKSSCHDHQRVQEKETLKIV